MLLLGVSYLNSGIFSDDYFFDDLLIDLIVSADLTIASSLAIYLRAVNTRIAETIGNTALREKAVPGSLVKNL